MLVGLHVVWHREQDHTELNWSELTETDLGHDDDDDNDVCLCKSR